MQRELVTVPRITLERKPPLIPCCYADGMKDRWAAKLQSCGELVPYAPRNPCPNCGQRLVASHAPPPTEASRIITGNTAIVDAASGEIAVVHMVCASDLATRFAESMRPVYFDTQVYAQATTTARLNGMAVVHRTYGYAPPQPMRRRYGCSRSQFNTEYPEAMEILAEFCRLAEHVFRIHAVDAHDDTAGRVGAVIAPAWRISGTPWTSGIINKTAALPYHVDKDNVPLSWSAMLVARRAMGGGLLHLADYDTYLAVPHGSITLFDGQSIVHGVTPMTTTGPHSYRYSTVVYAKQLMKKCCPNPRDEPARAAMEATLAEDRRITRGRLSK
jgi:hypothetical protein